MGLRWVIAGGGTGGHVFPGIALADTVKHHSDAAELLFLGTEKGVETKVVRKAGFDLKTLPVRPVRGTSVGAKVAAAVELVPALIGARAVLQGFGPDLVVGVGGYGSFPGALAAYSMRIPVVLLEQNARPGLTNRLLGRLADRVCVSFPETVAAFPAGVAVHTGNPVRFSGPIRRPSKEGFSVLVFGGSAGAHRLNVEFPAALRVLGERAKGFSVLHQTGAEDRQEVEEQYRQIGLRAMVVEFIEDMCAAYACADLVISRSGATTVAELTTVARPALLVPYPFSADQHQEHNARSLVRAGAARMILETELSPERLARELEELSRDRQLLERMETCALRAGNPQAGRRVLDQCLIVVERRRKSG